ncbi:Lrp/AsnC family transcriptional regulator [Galactobacter caseinivorans]|uniref:Lrp/AsnC family transcriptional regulator n=1 Tax=Galactobacter caseinivorans TaxID=2676123 RepID=A0A496PKU5_9MICC|nr:Lrp/AsnC ligand binding domain-containing protein [Galactobacter caseinivorans]RKW71136.1 Lrp/AsnC family transcriptional regulator [Galactobacter caseinivorans]
MITAFVMIQVDAGLIPEAAQQISELEGVAEVYSIAGGDWDLIGVVRVRRHEDLADVIPNRLSKVPGVVGTTTHIAFRAFSQHDLEAAFSLGLE